jgi:hypothetical protein
MPHAPLLILLLLGAASPLAAGEPRTIKIRMPRIEVPPGESVEVCYFTRIRRAAPFDLAEWRVRHRGAGGSVALAHFLVYQYLGEELAAFAQDGGRLVASRGCLGLGPTDRDRRVLVASRTLSGAERTPPGIALRLAPGPATRGAAVDGLGILVGANWVNGGTKARSASSRLVLKSARRGTLRRVARPILARSPELGLVVPPGTMRSTEATTALLNAERPNEPPIRDAWGAGLDTAGLPPPPGDACVVNLTCNLHERVRLFAVDHAGAAGETRNPPGGPANPLEPGRTHLFVASDYTDPGRLQFPRPLHLQAGESLRFACWYDNGVSGPERLGCEVVAGMPPGTPAGLPGGAPARPCAISGPASPDCPAGAGLTGACVAANLVAGPTPDDATCALTGFYYDAAPGAGCDVGSLPPID